jgi:A/G-specific adenine glycosylase
VDKDEFQEIIWQKGRELYRPMPWRENTDPYYIFVSELMLQQTQVDRVIPKFVAFIERFPTLQALAATSLAEVLVLWSGLGYNRRAKYLHDAAKKVTSEFRGEMPRIYAELVTLPGIGPNTGGAIMNYAYNVPTVFIETNVRTVYFHHFFEEDYEVSDREVRQMVDQTLDQEHPREFYWALMDYGSWLKRQGAGRITKSKHYKKQSPLKGSIREIRGQIIRQLTSQNLTREELTGRVDYDLRFDSALDGLIADGLVVQTGQELHLTK